MQTRWSQRYALFSRIAREVAVACNLRQMCRIHAVHVQGYGVQVDPSQIGTPAFEAAIMQVLTDPKYRQVAQAISKQVRARKRTPVQEAAGEQVCGSAVPSHLPTTHLLKQAPSCMFFCWHAAHARVQDNICRVPTPCRLD